MKCLHCESEATIIETTETIPLQNSYIEVLDMWWCLRCGGRWSDSTLVHVITPLELEKLIWGEEQENPQRNEPTDGTYV